MIFGFDINKVIQASAVLLKGEDTRRMSRLHLLKLLYIADRESLQERGRPITGDRPVAMDHGPVLSKTYNLIKGEDPDGPAWDRYVRRVGPRDVELIDDPGVGKLTVKEIAKLHDVAARFTDSEDYAAALYTHEFQEWLKNQPPANSSRPIPIEDLLEATGRSNDRDQILSAATDERVLANLLRDDT